jgi:hypothetical protein
MHQQDYNLYHTLRINDEWQPKKKEQELVLIWKNFKSRISNSDLGHMTRGEHIGKVWG